MTKSSEAMRGMGKRHSCRDVGRRGSSVRTSSETARAMRRKRFCIFSRLMSSLLPKRFILTRTLLPALRGMTMILVVIIASSSWALCDTTNKALVVLDSLDRVF